MPTIAQKSLTGGFVAFFSFLVFLNLAHAYATPGTTGSSLPFMGATPSEEASWSGQSWSTISAPFESFLQSLQSAGQSVTAGSGGNFNPPAMGYFPAMPSSWGDAATAEAHNAFLQFDAWLAGIIGFHIATILGVFLSVIDWVLRLTQALLNWLLSLIRS